MALKGKYLIELEETTPDAAQAARVCALLEGDAALIENARRRARYEKDDRWWSVPAGVLLIAIFVIYSLGLTMIALGLAAATALYLAAIFSWMGIKRARLRRTDNEISPQRSADALMRIALALPPSGRDITRLFPGDQMREFSGALLGEMTARARECGVEPESWTLKTETDLSGVVSSARDMVAIPVFHTVTAAGNGGQCEFICERMATFAGAVTGDFVPVDCSPAVARVTPLDISSRTDSISRFIKCPHCGAMQSERALKTRDWHCLGCGNALKQKAP